MNTVGTYLKKEREANNISLMEVARRTKISPVYLEHIEKNEFKKIPQGPYIKGYIASYSSVIGCDADELIGMYESENRNQAQAQTEAFQPATASIEGGKHLADKSEKEKFDQSSRLWLGKLRSWFGTFVSSGVIKGISFKRAEKPNGSVDSFKKDKRTPSRQNDLRIRRSGFLGTLYRRATVRRIGVYSGIAIAGACILILAGVGSYHLFFYESHSSRNAETEKSPAKAEGSLPSVGSEPLNVFSESSEESGTADTTESHGSKNRLSQSAKAETGRSGKRNTVEITSSPSNAATQAGTPSSGAPSAAKVDASSPDTADPERTVPPGRPRPIDASSARQATVEAPLRVLKATICRAVDNRMPVGVDRVFSISDGKIYVWTEIEAKAVPSKVHHIYYLNGEKVSDVSLDVRSNRWRTWSFKTMANRRYRGEWRVDIVASEGNILRRLYFEVK